MKRKKTNKRSEIEGYMKNVLGLEWNEDLLKPDEDLKRLNDSITFVPVSSVENLFGADEEENEELKEIFEDKQKSKEKRQTFDFIKKGHQK